MTTNEFDPIYQTTEAARLLGYKDRHSLWRLVREGKLPAPIKLTPRRSGWRRSTLEQFLLERKGIVIPPIQLERAFHKVVEAQRNPVMTADAIKLIMNRLHSAMRDQLLRRRMFSIEIMKIDAQVNALTEALRSTAGSDARNKRMIERLAKHLSRLEDDLRLHLHIDEAEKERLRLVSTQEGWQRAKHIMGGE